MKKLIKAVIKLDLNTRDLANAFCDVFIKFYDKHNYDEFKKVVNERLKS